MTGREEAMTLIFLLVQLHQVQSQWWGYGCSESACNSYTQPTYYVPSQTCNQCAHLGYYGSYTQPQTYTQSACYNPYEQFETCNQCQQPSNYGPYAPPQIYNQCTQCSNPYVQPQICNQPLTCCQSTYESVHGITYIPPGTYDCAQLPIPNDLPPFAYPYSSSPIIIINGGDDCDDVDSFRGKDRFSLNSFLDLLLTLQGANNAGPPGPPPPPPPPLSWGGYPGVAPPVPLDTNQYAQSGNGCCCNSCGESGCCSKSCCGCSKSKCGCPNSECESTNSGNRVTGNNCGSCTHITIIMPISSSCEN